MKILILLSALLISISSWSQNKLGLIVAVGEYPAASRVPPIASVNDVPYVKAALKKNGFLEKNIDTLINSKATKAAILRSLTALAVKAKKNDIVVIHFACHGQQIRDQRTAELGKDEDDGYDEALLPYDAQGSYRSPGYKGENHLRDDDLYPKLMAIRKAIGAKGSLLVLLDACHSGTGTRAESFGASRGEPIPFPDPENPMDSTINIAGAEVNDSFFDNEADSLSNMVVISGSGPHQQNKQLVVNYEEVGSLSYSFYKAITEMGADKTYEELYQKIKANIQAFIPDQLPMLEGNSNQIIFSGKYTPKEEKIYARVGIKNMTTGGKDSVFTIEKGMMDDIYPGTACMVYNKSNQLVGKAIIRRAENFKSIGVINTLLQQSELYEVKFEEESLGTFLAGLQLKFNKNDPEAKQIEKQVELLVKPYKFLSFTKNADYLFELKSAEGKQLATVVDRNDKIVWSRSFDKGDSLSATDKKQFIADIKKAMRVKYLRLMPDGGALAGQVKVSIVPELNPEAGGEPSLEMGQKYSLRIENNSNRKLFYTVLDILPDNTIDVLYPYKDKDPSNYSIEKRAVVLRKLGIPAQGIAGREVLKVIVSKEPMDLRSVFARKKERSETNSIQRTIDDLFKDSDDEKATRADVSSISVEEVGILTAGFTVKKK